MNESNVNDEYEEEEIIVYADFDTILKGDELKMDDPQIKIIGIDSENPVIQVNGKIFSGSYENALGTNVFFEEDPNPQNYDKLFDICPDTYYKVACKTIKNLQMKRIFVQLNETDHSEHVEEPAAVVNEEELKRKYAVDKTYEQALNQFLKPNETQPREMLIESVEHPYLQRKDKAVEGDNEDDMEIEEDDPKDEDYIPYELDA